MFKTLLKATALSGAMVLAFAPAAHAQNWGDIIGGAASGDEDQVVCGVFGSCEDDQQSNDSEMSEIELGLMLVQTTNMLNSAERTATPSADQAQLYNYSDNYAVQSGMMGGFVGALAGCLIADYLLDASCSEGMLIGAPLGGVAGAVIGSRIGERQEVYRDQEASLNTKLTTARSDLEDARSARVAAERVANSHRTRLTQLQADYDREAISQSEFEQEIGYMMEDIEALTAARNGLNGQIELLREQIDQSQTTPEERAEAQRIIADLQTESDQMTEALNAMTGNVQTARI